MRISFAFVPTLVGIDKSLSDSHDSSKLAPKVNNVLNLLRLEKKILVYFAPTQSFQTVRTTDDLRALLALCDQQDVAMFEKELCLQQFFTAMRPQLSFNLFESNVDLEKVVAL